MIKSKATDILGSFSKKEFRMFGKYLDSQVFSANKSLPKLYNYLSKYYPSFTSEKISKENIYRSAYGSLPYNDAKFRKLMSELYKEAEKFMVAATSLVQRDIYDKILLEQFDIRKLDNLFVSKYEEYNAYLDGEAKHYQYFIEKYFVEWRNIIFHLERDMQYKIAMNVYKRTEYLIFAFLSDFCLSLNDINSNKETYNIENSIDLAEEFISNLNDKKLFEYIDKNNFANKELVFSFYLAYKAMKYVDDESHYYRLKDFALKNINKFHEGSQKTTVIFLINYCNRKVRRGEEKFQKELNECYNLYITYKLYKISGENYIRSDFFLNVLSNYFSLGKTQEAAKFIEDNSESLQPAHRKNMLAISKALIYFEKKNFRESLKSASLIKSNTFLYKDKIKMLLLKNNYELKNFEIALEQMNSYKTYLNTNKHVTEHHKEKMMKFLYYYSILWKIYDGKLAKNDLKHVREELLKEQQTNDIKWIISKLDELKIN